MSEQKRTLTQSRRLRNNRRWGSAYRAGRPETSAPSAQPPRTGTTNAPTVIELARHREPARS